jgi:hypothetical protein
VSHCDRALDSAVTYHRHVATGLTTSHDHLIAAELAGDVADAEYTLAAEASSAGERQMFLRAGDKARAMRDFHKLAAELAAIGEQVIGQ